jgi:hypothetical protein
MTLLEYSKAEYYLKILDRDGISEEDIAIDFLISCMKEHMKESGLEKDYLNLIDEKIKQFEKITTERFEFYIVKDNYYSLMDQGFDRDELENNLFNLPVFLTNSGNLYLPEKVEINDEIFLGFYDVFIKVL